MGTKLYSAGGLIMCTLFCHGALGQGRATIKIIGGLGRQQQFKRLKNEIARTNPVASLRIWTISCFYTIKP